MNITNYQHWWDKLWIVLIINNGGLNMNCANYQYWWDKAWTVLTINTGGGGKIWTVPTINTGWIKYEEY